MAVEKEYGRFVPTCDGCGATLKPQDTFEEAKEAMNRAGWSTEKVPTGWENYCTDCKED